MSNKDERQDPNEIEQVEPECGEPGRDEEAVVEQQIKAGQQRKEFVQEHPEDTALPRIGVYICRCGGNISDVVDVEHVAEIARMIPGVALAKVHDFVCSDPGQQTISNDILKENLDRVVVASCSPFLHETTFRGAVSRGGMNPYLYEHVNIREQASWAHKHDPAGATSKSIRMIAAAVGKLRHAVPLEQIKLPNHRRALVIGGGIAGMKAAADLSGRGIRVLLVEGSEMLGGHLNERGKVYASEQDADELVAELKRAVSQNANIEVVVNSKVSAVSGFIGNFKVVVESLQTAELNMPALETTVGAIIMATGFRPYVPQDGEFLYRTEPCVVTMPEFIQLMRSVRPEEKWLTYRGQAIRNIAFLHCVGSRQLDGVHEPGPNGRLNTYCSRTCCTTILQQALAVRNRFPQVGVFDFNQDIRTYGRGEENYYTDASKAGVTFFRYNGEEPPKVEATVRNRARDGALSVTVKDALTWGEELTLGVDMVVLGTGMMPGQIDDLIEQIKLSTGEDGFLQEVHPKLRPVEVAVNGVLLAGTAQGPMNIQETLAAAGAAAVKAAAMFATEDVELNPYVAAVDLSLCCGEAQCVTQCDYEGALKIVQMEMDGAMVERAQVNAGLCVGCGACVAVCPHRAIDLNGWRIDQFEAMVDGLAADIPSHECSADLVSIE
ncbi:MAG TPA: FAD-dependent oxidoreductase [Acidobacteriaceae bacterium]|nr:FAD-dependent oxidoreductase [Acidobacteriaceae bacterium]